MEAFVSPDGKKIFFTAYDSMNVKIWYVNRGENKWSEAKMLETSINKDMVFYANSAANGDLYYTNVSKRKMYYAPNHDEEYPQIFEADNEYGGHGYISPSQDFMLLDARKDNDKNKDRDIHVCFREKDGGWSKPINLGDKINSEFNETCPSLSADGKYIFFSRYNEEGGLSNIYWVSSEIINQCKNEITNSVVVNGKVEENEWKNAKEYKFESNEIVEAKVLIKQDKHNLYMAFLVKAFKDSTYIFPEFFIDTQNDKSEKWNEDDYWFHISAQDCHSIGKREDYSNCSVNDNVWKAVPNYPFGDAHQKIEEFEIFVPLNFLKIKSGDKISICFSLSIYPGKLRINFPTNAHEDIPATWQEITIE